MAKAQSEHPGLVKAANDRLSALKKGLSKAAPLVRELSAGAASLKAAADATEKSLRDQQTYCEKLVEKYVTKANEIAEIEMDLEEAEGDKKAEAELLKKHKKADSEATAIREAYGKATEALRTLFDTVKEAREKIDAAADKLASVEAGD